MSDFRVVESFEDALTLQLRITGNELAASKYGQAVIDKTRQGNPTTAGLRALLDFYIERERLLSS